MLKLNRQAPILAIAVLLLVHPNVDALTRPSSIRLVNNGYTGIVVAIHSNVPESDELIERIKYMFTEGSKYLYEATRKRAYFKEVTILVPKSWTPKPEYQLPGNVTFDYADVIVAPPNPRWAPLQYTKQYQGCGKQGVHIHFMDKFLTDPNTERYYGPLGRTLVHEWGHFRWGLFDEYPDPVGDPDNYKEFYFSSLTQQFEGVRCSYEHNAVPLIFYPNQVYYRRCNGGPDIGYEAGCVYYVSTNQDKVSSSVMFSSYPLPPIKYFCDDDSSDTPNLHNREAPNKHNRLCGGRSNWEVLRDHQDFRNNSNPPVDLNEDDLIPNITIVQHQDIRVVLLLDTSGSMSSGSRFEKMISSSAKYISYTVLNGSYIGIVEFSSSSTVLEPLRLVANDTDRQALLSSLPTSPVGGTGIGGGLLKAVQVLSEKDVDSAVGIILLITDGQENEKPFVADVMDDIVESKVIVYTLAFTQAADHILPKLSEATGGKAYFYSNDGGSESNALDEAFAATMQRGGVGDADKRVQLVGTSWTLASKEARTGSVFLDSTLGRNTEFVFSWTTANVLAISVSIKHRNGSFINCSNDCSNLSFRILSVSIPGQAKAGLWEFTVFNLLTSTEEVTITISSHPASDDVEPIIVTSELSDSIAAFASGEPLVAYAEVRQGFSPMIYANVWATIERPGGYDPIKMQLLDNGAGADVTKNDGVYSRYFTEVTGVGYYGVKIDVDNNNGNAIIIDSVPFSKSRPIVDPDKAFDLPDIGGVKIPLPGTPPVEPTGKPAPAFSRGVSGGSSRVDDVPPGFSPGDDLFPPGDVLDLKVTNSSFTEATVTLAWTAPGADLDNGAASWYEVIRAESIQAWQNDSTPDSHLILNSSHILQGNLSAPQEFGDEEELVVLVPVPEGATVASYAFVLRAFDDAGKSSGFSNAVQAVLREYIPGPLPPPVVTEVPPDRGLQPWQIALIAVGGIMAVLLLLGIIIFMSGTRLQRKLVKSAKGRDNRSYVQEEKEF
ncbi:epithelial chloride channel protein-like [Acanthaster planci]|uniref:Epithelial chloride channel protein-like n=1 Tax=Acanthaster planci TaxID=133434 RepID=A0A8B7XII1_ACAPL|nr:epithelial chloride channel protein-like [Acanthaster planci]